MYDRRKSIGASDAVHIWAGDWADLYDRKQGTTAPEYPLAARIGHELEDLNRELFEEDTGLEIDTGTIFDDFGEMKPWNNASQGRPWCTYLPDGLIHDEEYLIPFEAKAINMMWNPANLLRKYMPQLQHAMRVMGAPYSYFSVIYLNTKYEHSKIKYDPIFDAELLELEKLFYWFLEHEQRPPEQPKKRRQRK